MKPKKARVTQVKKKSEQAKKVDVFIEMANALEKLERTAMADVVRSLALLYDLDISSDY